ncbi:MAG TPA: VTT domain-containing protein [Candidatus Paceibacterota bacterium]|nr:MAG: hypothetical protein B7X03_02960 [Parcubacteria group bacterium 21-58-10]HQT83159.1 VTT domain-containing protein [Candidatus Paceibacterota bacterium]
MSAFFSAVLHLDPVAIVQTGSYLGISLIIFAESGLLIGILFPGDSLLFASGLLAANGILAVGPLAFAVVVAAILGDSLGYWFGARFGIGFFEREESFFFKREYVQRTERFYERYGGRAIVLARFVPVVRTIAPVLAGIGSMTYKKFLVYNALGGLLWGAGMLSLGYSIGSVLPSSEKYILPLSLVIIVVSFIPVFVNLLRGKKGAT